MIPLYCIKTGIQNSDTDKKTPITPDILQRIIAVFGDRNEISKLRICVLFLLRFSVFLRYSELSNIKMLSETP
jgi:hypothetical protein